MAKQKELEAIISFAGEIAPSLDKSIKGAEKSLGGFDKKAALIAGGIAAAGVAIGAVAVKAGKALFELDTEFKKAENTIRVGTGATGDDLEALMDDFDKVYSSVPASMEDASQAIADYNTRLGLTGDDLSEMAGQAINVSRLLGDDMTSVIEESSQAFNQWGIEADSMSGKMDYIFKVSQSTGVGFTDLLSTMQSSGVVLQDLGYSFDDAAAMLGSLDKAGVDTNQVLAGMKKGLTTVAKEGGDVTATMTDYVNEIMAASDEAEALSIASEVFGSRSAAAMVQAIQSGALSVDELTASLNASGESISAAAKDTYTLEERMQMLKQKSQVALEPLANKAIEIAEKAMPYIETALEQLIPIAESVGEQVMPIVDAVVSHVTPIIEKIIPMIITGVQTIVPAIGEVVAAIYDAVAPAIEFVMPYVEKFVSWLLPKIALLIRTLVPIIQNLALCISLVLKKAFETIVPIIENVINVISGMGTTLSNVFSSIVGIVKAPINAVISIVNKAIDAVNSISVDIPDWVPGVGGKHLGFDFSKIPMLASGGFTNGASIAGEAGTEAVISFDPAFRSANIGYWAKAGEMLGLTSLAGNLIGMDSFSLSELAAGNGTVVTNNYYNTFSPTVSSGDDSDALTQLKHQAEEFFDWFRAFSRAREEVVYG